MKLNEVINSETEESILDYTRRRQNYLWTKILHTVRDIQMSPIAQKILLSDLHYMYSDMYSTDHLNKNESDFRSDLLHRLRYDDHSSEIDVNTTNLIIQQMWELNQTMRNAFQIKKQHLDDYTD